MLNSNDPYKTSKGRCPLGITKRVGQRIQGVELTLAQAMSFFFSSYKYYYILINLARVETRMAWNVGLLWTNRQRVPHTRT